VEHSRNTDENIHLVELNALAFTNTDEKKQKQREYKRLRKKLNFKTPKKLFYDNFA